MGRQRKAKTWRGGIKRKDARLLKEKRSKKRRKDVYVNEVYTSDT